MIDLLEKIAYGMFVLGGWLSMVGFLTWVFIQALNW